jgi:NTE family protein
MSGDDTADLVLEGGGVKGIGLVGALSVLEEAGYRFPKVAGTSAGSIVGALVAARMSAAEMYDVMNGLPYIKFKDKGLLDRVPIVGKAASLLFEKGIYEGRYITKWLDQQLAARKVHTFGDLALDDPGTSLPEDRRYRLVAMTSDVCFGRLRRLPWDYKECYDVEPTTSPVSQAVRASMSIPFFYEPLRLDYEKPDGGGKRKEHVFLVDGGMLSNFPVDVFDRTDGQMPRWPTFGIKLSAKPLAEQPPIDISGPVGMAKAMISTLTGFYDQMHLDEPAVVDRTIFVDTTGVKATDFDLDQETQDRLYQNGRDAASKFLETWNFERYVEKYRAPAS